MPLSYEENRTCMHESRPQWLVRDTIWRQQSTKRGEDEHYRAPLMGSELLLVHASGATFFGQDQAFEPVARTGDEYAQRPVFGGNMKHIENKCSMRMNLAA
eukprot:58240-Amphidinium_carterae.2